LGGNWIQATRGKWWAVDATALPLKVEGFGNHRLGNVGEGDTTLNDEELAVMRMKVDEEKRLAQEESDAAAHEFEIGHDENTEWLHTSEWPRWLRNRPLQVTVAACKAPSAQDIAHSIGHWAGE
jgi:hypothetical protein